MASHCQDISNQKKVITYLKANKMSEFAPNLTITKDGSHPDVKGIRLMPYYIIFDHTGKLRAHHMCGSYHGGDEWRMIEIVDELLAKTPPIYLGAEPFKKIAPLAAQVAPVVPEGLSMLCADALARNPARDLARRPPSVPHRRARPATSRAAAHTLFEGIALR